MMLTFDDFKKVDMRVGTIVDASINRGARKPAYKLKIDLGDMGIKNSSAQITTVYKPEDIIGKQVICVVNFEPIKISEVKSEVLVLGLDTDLGVVLLTTERDVTNGRRVY
ncbi:MAG: tRNA-binding protein [Tenericutes bacterium]|nr:tRNA-binding protein [Mycoplasmatota bacterium]